MQMRKVIDGTAFYDTISFNELWDPVKPAIGRRRHAQRHPTVLLPRSVSHARTRQPDNVATRVASQCTTRSGLRNTL